MSVIRGMKGRISSTRKLCRVVDESTLSGVDFPDVGGEDGVRHQQQPAPNYLEPRRDGNHAARRNADDPRLTVRKRGILLLGNAAKLPVKMVWSAFKFMCLYSDRGYEGVDVSGVFYDPEEVNRMLFRIQNRFDDRNYLMVQDSARFAILM